MVEFRYLRAYIIYMHVYLPIASAERLNADLFALVRLCPLGFAWKWPFWPLYRIGRFGLSNLLALMGSIISGPLFLDLKLIREP